MIFDEIARVKNFFNCELEPITLNFFSEYKKIPARTRGVYIIYDDKKTYYVGKGSIKNRQPHHVEKFTGNFKNAQDTAGFKLLRENLNDVDLSLLKITFMKINSETLISAVEGSLIHLLQPTANDEVIKTSKSS